MRRSRPLRAVLLTWHITAGAGWFALLAVQVMLPWHDLKIYLIETANIAVITGLWLALGSALGLVRYWWIVGKLLGTTALVTVGSLALKGFETPWARPMGLIVLWLLIWLSVARPGGKTPYGRAVITRKSRGG